MPQYQKKGKTKLGLLFKPSSKFRTLAKVKAKT